MKPIPINEKLVWDYDECFITSEEEERVKQHMLAGLRRQPRPHASSSGVGRTTASDPERGAEAPGQSQQQRRVQQAQQDLPIGAAAGVHVPLHSAHAAQGARLAVLVQDHLHDGAAGPGTGAHLADHGEDQPAEEPPAPLEAEAPPPAPERKRGQGSAAARPTILDRLNRGEITPTQAADQLAAL